jgi:hypothetical protein
MDNDQACGAPLPGGRHCQVRRDRCTWHGAGTPRAGPRRLPGPPAGLQERDPRTLGWALLGRLFDGTQDARTIATAAALLRLVAGLGPEDPDLDDALRAVELHGRAWHGLPPRDSDGWRRAEALFGPEALEEISRWAEERAASGAEGGSVRARLRGRFRGTGQLRRGRLRHGRAGGRSSC